MYHLLNFIKIFSNIEMRKKLTDDKKKKRFSLTIDEKLSEILDKHLEDIDMSNKSKYIESLIREDMEKRGENVEREF